MNQSLRKSISRGKRDRWLWLRTNFAAVPAIAIAATVSACLMTPLVGDDLSPLIRGLFLVACGWTFLLSCWLTWNRRLSYDVRKAIFEHARTITDETQRREWYASATAWLEANRMAANGRDYPFPWGWRLSRAFSKLYWATKRRADGWDHYEIETQRRCVGDAFLDEMRKGLDALEERPSYFDEQFAVDSFTARWPVLFLITFFMLTLVLGISPSRPIRQGNSGGDSAAKQ